MSGEPRKASDVLLELESKLDILIGLVRTQDLNNKLISNKLNEVMQTLSKQASNPQKITVEAANVLPTVRSTPIQNFQVTDSERQVPIFAEAKLPETDTPMGFRRTARPETFGNDGSQPKDAPVKFPMQMPAQMQNTPPNPNKPPPGRGTTPETFPPPPPKQAAPKSQTTGNRTQQSVVQNAIPVQQRVVDKGGKSVFLADVEITNLATPDSGSVFKTRTNGTGKWMASLGVGAYRVVIRKGESITKSKLEAIQDIQIDGSQSPLELQTLIIK